MSDRPALVGADAAVVTVSLPGRVRADGAVMPTLDMIMKIQRCNTMDKTMSVVKMSTSII